MRDHTPRPGNLFSLRAHSDLDTTAGRLDAIIRAAVAARAATDQRAHLSSLPDAAATVANLRDTLAGLPHHELTEIAVIAIDEALHPTGHIALRDVGAACEVAIADPTPAARRDAVAIARAFAAMPVMVTATPVTTMAEAVYRTQAPALGLRGPLVRLAATTVGVSASLKSTTITGPNPNHRYDLAGPLHAVQAAFLLADCFDQQLSAHLAGIPGDTATILVAAGEWVANLHTEFDAAPPPETTP